MEMQLLDKEELDSLRALENGPDDSFFDELVDLFIEQTPEVMVVLNESVEKGDPQAVERAAHRLKGMGRNLGALAFSHICAKIEYEVSQKGIEAVDDATLVALKETHEATCVALRDQKTALH